MFLIQRPFGSQSPGCPRQEITERPEIQTRPVIDKDDAMCLTEVPLGVPR